MPFLWKKKNRVTRISQIVADFQSPKRGRSLFVETGFPTSLIDLFVKNRNRFKKTRFKKPVHSDNTDLSPSSSPSPPPPPPSSPVTPPSPIHDFSSEDVPILNPMIGENTDESAVGDSPPVEKPTSTFRSKAIVVKTLTVIVLAASVKELTVAITVSAFALLFLENALKRAVSCLKPCSNASVVAIESRFSKILFRVKDNEIQQPVTVFNEVELLNLNHDEIEAVEEEKSEELGICCELEESMVSECKIKGKGSRSGRFKATMVKKLQKFRSKRERKEEEKGISNFNNNSYEDDKVEDKEAIIIIRNEVRDDCGITYSTESIIAGKKNSGYAILVMIVLIGLIVGRLQALILTIGWCFLVKMVKVIWRSKNVSSLMER
ncbi:uncharacterized protein LOC131622405 [Vicia villosa]|uniref:uncharacterized protein LOC131622405 n=1 Tax=Vicia villosa TaxID=3911 RepID=UPI00273C8084|nr:uncharacterized protein LOC131622405 [Vicia villosa]